MVQRAHYLVVEHPLVVVHVACVVGVKAVQVLGQLGQVVGAAGLVDVRVGAQVALSVGCHVVVHAQHLRIGLSEHLSVAHSARGVGIASLHQVPEVQCQVVVAVLSVSAVAAQGTRYLRYVLVGVAGAYVINVSRQRFVEGGTVKEVRSLQQTGLLRGVAHHLRQSCQRLARTAVLAGNVHVPHLVAVAGSGPSFLACALRLHVGAVVHSVPYPQAHILGRQQRLGCHLGLVHVGGNVYQPRQLLVYGVVGSPHPLLVVVAPVHLYQGCMVGGYGVQVAVAVLAPLLLVAVKSFPGTLHGAQLLLGGEVARLPVASQRVVPHEGAFLARTQLVHHAPDTLAQGLLLPLVRGTGQGKGQGRHVVPRAVSLQLGGGRVPSIAHRIALGRQSVGIAIVVKLLADVPAQYGADGQFAVGRQSVVTLQGHAVQRQRFGHRLCGRYVVGTVGHRHLCRDGVSGVGGVVARHPSLYPVLLSGGVEPFVGLLLFGSQCRVAPARLAVLAGAVAVRHPYLVRQSGHSAHGRFHPDGFHASYLLLLSCSGQCHQQSRHYYSNIVHTQFFIIDCSRVANIAFFLHTIKNKNKRCLIFPFPSAEPSVRRAAGCRLGYAVWWYLSPYAATGCARYTPCGRG